MRFLLYHWKATLASGVLFVAGLAIGFGFGGGSRRDITTTRLVTRVLTEPPTHEGVYVDYGQYARYVKLIGLQWIIEGPSVGGGHVEGQAQYLGGLGCRVLRSLEVKGTLFDETGKAVETLRPTITRLPRKSRVPITITHKSLVNSGRIEFFVARANC